MKSFKDFICFQLGAATRKIQKYYNSRYAQFGITIAQSFILFSLLENEGMNAKSLAEQLDIDSSAITGLIDRMEKEGLVERRIDPSDRRAFCISLTEEGRKLAEAVLPVAEEFNDRLKSGLKKSEERALVNFLRRVENLEINM